MPQFSNIQNLPLAMVEKKTTLNATLLMSKLSTGFPVEWNTLL
jgi:hypothetical protein